MSGARTLLVCKHLYGVKLIVYTYKMGWRVFCILGVFGLAWAVFVHGLCLRWIS